MAGDREPMGAEALAVVEAFQKLTAAQRFEAYRAIREQAEPVWFDYHAHLQQGLRKVG